MMYEKKRPSPTTASPPFQSAYKSYYCSVGQPTWSHCFNSITVLTKVGITVGLTEVSSASIMTNDVSQARGLSSLKAADRPTVNNCFFPRAEIPLRRSRVSPSHGYTIGRPSPFQGKTRDADTPTRTNTAQPTQTCIRTRAHHSRPASRAPHPHSVSRSHSLPPSHPSSATPGNP